MGVGVGVGVSDGLGVGVSLAVGVGVAVVRVCGVTGGAAAEPIPPLHELNMRINKIMIAISSNATVPRNHVR